MDLDEFYRRCLADGLAYHRGQGRGLLPGGLIEEIRALTEPPVPWDVELARWFDDHFAPLDRRRSYARASRRQAATPDIPRPGWHLPEELTDSRAFGVVLDTSGSMDRRLLGKALGAIASYAVTRDVHAVRVVFCDTQAHDNGWMHPFDIAGRVRVRGRGGTVLQPGIDLLLAAPDFPKDGPVLVITDGWTDRVRISREHAFLIPAGATLPVPAARPGVPLLIGAAWAVRLTRRPAKVRGRPGVMVWLGESLALVRDLFHRPPRSSPPLPRPGCLGHRWHGAGSLPAMTVHARRAPSR